MKMGGYHNPSNRDYPSGKSDFLPQCTEILVCVPHPGTGPGNGTTGFQLILSAPASVPRSAALLSARVESLHGGQR
ncbi:hypothetical protein J6590_047807 [Homalodisca vitripennis]|nr:hypothetical protein J6590_047807 [Homalodisca vitripennis]